MIRREVASSVLDEAEAAVVAVAAKHSLDRFAIVSALADRLSGIADPLLRISEVAAILAVDRRTVQRYHEAGHLIAIDINPTGDGRPEHRIVRSSLEAFLARCRSSRKRAKEPVRSPAILDRQNKARAATARRTQKRPRQHLV